ncbi:hypothetical protein [Nonomuraea polychroma]|uniref:hypothetical protein n=1 Tax=Nonomuraea polychroma TaxID=46176 RepID=UPI001F4D583E|nr:hypothetical protein [Nonomuraea polychroma]
MPVSVAVPGEQRRAQVGWPVHRRRRNLLVAGAATRAQFGEPIPRGRAQLELGDGRVLATAEPDLGEDELLLQVIGLAVGTAQVGSVHVGAPVPGFALARGPPVTEVATEDVRAGLRHVRIIAEEGVVDLRSDQQRQCDLVTPAQVCGRDELGSLEPVEAGAPRATDVPIGALRLPGAQSARRDPVAARPDRVLRSDGAHHALRAQFQPFGLAGEYRADGAHGAGAGDHLVADLDLFDRHETVSPDGPNVAVKRDWESALHSLRGKLR